MSDELPTLVVLGEEDGFFGLFSDPKKQVVPYRYDRDVRCLVVDRVLKSAALIAGTGGDEIMVRIERRGGR